MRQSASQAWTAFLRDPEAADHAVQVYAEPAELARSVVAYLVGGFERDQPAVGVVTPEHWRPIAAGLAAAGWAETPLLRLLDARETLAAVCLDGRPDPERFEAVVGRELEAASASNPGALVRAFGEMVDLLVRDGQREEALELERLWDVATRTREFALLCAYVADPFEVDAQLRLLPAVCSAHSHVLLAPDPERFQHAVDAALYEILGPEDASRVYRSIAEAVEREPGVPVAQHALMWVSAHMPARAEIIVADARRRYRLSLQPAAV